MFQSLKQKLTSGQSQLLRRITTTQAPEIRRYVDVRDLYKRLWAVQNSNAETISKVLDEMMMHNNGPQFTRSDLLDCLKDLRKYGRYRLCLEIYEWMEKGRYESFYYSTADYASRLSLMCKVKSIDEVEKYFSSIPNNVKNHHTYGALLNCYCTKMMTDKALSLFEKMDELNYASNVVAFNNLMCLYLKVGQPEKVPSLVEEMKHRNIQLNSFSYKLLMQSYRYLVDLEGIERVMHDVKKHKYLKEDWTIYSNLAVEYIKFGQSEKAKAALNRMEEIIDNSELPDRLAYHNLITIHASFGNLDSVYQAWHKLKLRFKACQNISYFTMLLALSKLDDIEGLERCFKEWELNQLSFRSYDDRLPTVVIIAYLRHDKVEEAVQLLKDVEEKAKKSNVPAHIKFMNYLIEKHQFDSALKHMEAAMAGKWMPFPERLDPFFEHYIEEKDVDSAEELCRTIEKFWPLSSRTYLWLLKTYVAAGKEAPDMRQRMEESGVDITAEHEEFLQKIC